MEHLYVPGAAGEAMIESGDKGAIKKEILKRFWDLPDLVVADTIATSNSGQQKGFDHAKQQVTMWRTLRERWETCA
jgi:hypothetical protein